MAKRKGVVARVWQGSVGDRRPYANLVTQPEVGPPSDPVTFNSRISPNSDTICQGYVSGVPILRSSLNSRERFHAN